jgi:hypothetical protein
MQQAPRGGLYVLDDYEGRDAGIAILFHPRILGLYERGSPGFCPGSGHLIIVESYGGLL